MATAADEKCQRWEMLLSHMATLKFALVNLTKNHWHLQVLGIWQQLKRGIFLYDLRQKYAESMRSQGLCRRNMNFG